MYELTQEEQAFVDNSSDPTVARLCVLYAAAFNRLDIRLFEACLAPEVKYVSQVVLEDLEGRDRVLEYIGGKLATLKRVGPEALVRIELSTVARKPCALIYQRSSDLGSPGLGTAISHVQMKADGDGRVVEMVMCIIPTPESCRRTGLFPGLTVGELDADRAYRGRAIDLGKAEFLLFVYKETKDWYESMIETVRSVARDFGVPSVRIIDNRDDEEFRSLASEYGVYSFPTVVILEEGIKVANVEGFMDPKNLTERILDLYHPH